MAFPDPTDNRNQTLMSVSVQVDGRSLTLKLVSGVSGVSDVSTDYFVTWCCDSDPSYSGVFRNREMIEALLRVSLCSHLAREV